MSKNREKKERIVAELGEKAKRATSLIFANYQGLTHPQLEQLKKALKAVNAELVVTKNTLLKRALESANRKLVLSAVEGSQIANLEGPTATLFAYNDIIAPLKELAKTIKKLKLPASPSGGQGGPAIKFGILDGRMLAEHDVIRLSTLPTRDVLLAQLVGQMQSPLYGLRQALVWNMQKLLMTLKAIEGR